MIPFFRKIRKKMADDNKPVKYMRYAIGEILLVVIGILIALQVNNWNEKKKIYKNEQIFLNDLKYEINSNKKELERIINNHLKGLRDAYKLKELINHPEKISDISEDSIFKWTFQLQGIVFEPENGILNSIISSGQINTVRNKKLRYLISSLKEYGLQKMRLSNRINEMGWEVLFKIIYPEAIEISLRDINYSYNTDVTKWVDYKNMYLIPEFKVAVGAMFTTNRMVAIEKEKEVKLRYEEIVSLINLELE